MATTDTKRVPRPRVALVADHFHPLELPPEAKINTDLALYLSSRGFHVTVFTSGKAENPGSDPNITVVGGSTEGSLRATYRLATLIAAEPVETVIIMFNSNGFGHHPWISLLPPLLRRRFRFRGKIVAHFTNAETAPFGRVTRRMLRLIGDSGVRTVDWRIGGFADADRLVFYCSQHRDILLSASPHLHPKSFISPVPLTVAVREPSPTAVARIRQELNLGTDTKVVLFFGLIYPGKGIEDLLASIAILNERGHDSIAVIIGGSGGVTSDEQWNKTCDEYYERMKALTLDLRLSDRCRWIGHVDDTQLTNWFAISDVACLPFSGGIRSNNSTFAVCAAHGVPVVTTRWDGIDELFRSPGMASGLPVHAIRVLWRTNWSTFCRMQPFARQCQIKSGRFSISGLLGID